MRGTTILAFLSVACAVSYAQHDLYQLHVESVDDFIQLCQHGPITVDGSHVLDVGTKWNTAGGFIEDAGAHDHLVFGLTSQHVEGSDWLPPGEAWTFAEWVDSLEQRPASYHRLRPGTSVYRHVDHFDSFVGHGLVKMTHTGGVDEILGYTLTMRGEHRTTAVTGHSLDGDVVADQMNGASNSTAYGDADVFFDSATGRFDFAMTVNGLSHSKLVRVSLHAAPRGQTGSMIYDLGGPADWTDVGGTGLRRVLNDQQFPQLFTSALLGGNVYVLVRTQDYIEGEIRGQLSVAPFGSEPRTMRVVRGKVVSGIRELLANADRQRVVFGKFVVLNAQDPPIQVELDGWTPMTAPQSLDLFVKGSASVSGIQQTLSLYDHQAQAYVPLDTRQMSLTDSWTQVTVTQNVLRFVGADGTLKAKLSHRPSGPLAINQWSVATDYFRFRAWR